MTTLLETSSGNGSTIDLQQLVQWLSDEFQKSNDRISHELYENIAQSLVAIKTRLVLLEKKVPAGSREITEGITGINAMLHSLITEIRDLADSLHSHSINIHRFESTLFDLCTQYTMEGKKKVVLKYEPGIPQPEWIQRPQEFCLYTFVEYVLDFACKEEACQVSVSLEYQDDAVSIRIQIYQKGGLSQNEVPWNELLSVLQEWLKLWGGKLFCGFPSDSMLDLTARLVKPAI